MAAPGQGVAPDLSTLDDYDNEAAWLDDLLCAGSEDAETDLSLSALDQKLSKLLSLLDAATADASQLVNHSIEDIARGVPRLSFDLQLMRENALLLQYSLDGIRGQGALAAASYTSLIDPSSGHTQAAESTDAVVEKLRTLDMVKTRMESSRAVLREAESWSTLESDVTGFLTDSPPAYAKAAERLAEAARSMVVFQHTQEFEGRRGLMRSLQNELEASLSSSLVRAIGDRDIAACKEFYRLFGMIEREGEFRKYYFGSRRAHILTLWSSAHLVDCSSSIVASTPTPTAAGRTLEVALPQTMASFLAESFYPALLLLLTAELTYLPSIFPDPSATLSALLTTTLDALSPSLSARLSEVAERSEALVALAACWTATEHFACQVEGVFHKLSAFMSLEGNPTLAASPLPSPSMATPISPSPSTSLTPSVKRDRRASKRMSMSRRLSARRYSISGGLSPMLEEGAEGPIVAVGIESLDIVREWETALYEPFLDFHAMYPVLERANLAAQLVPHLRNHLGRGAPSARALVDGLMPIFAMGEEALKRCTAFTHSYGLPGCLKAIEAVLEEYLKRVKEVLEEEQRSREEARRKEAPATGADGSAGPQVELEGLDYSAEDWQHFQRGLKLLSACRLVSDRLTAFEAKVRSGLGGVAGHLQDSRYVPPGTTRGAIALIRQSPLNSVQLATLTQAVAPSSSHAQGRVSGASAIGLDSSEALSSAASVASTVGVTPTARPAHTHSFSISGGAQTSMRKEAPAPRPNAVALLLPAARIATAALTRACQAAVHSTILAPLISSLMLYPTLPVWTISEADARAAASSSAAFDLQMPNFSLSPTEAISRIGEGLFNLPRLFEVYAADEDALAFSIETLPYVDADSLLRSLGAGGALPSSPAEAQALRNPHLAATGFFDAGEASRPTAPRPKGHAAGAAPAPAPAQAAAAAAAGNAARPPIALPNLSAETVTSTWLSSLALSVLAHLTGTILPSIPRLSAHGAAQVASDLSYISNVARALDAEGDGLERWREACELDAAQLKRQLAELDSEDEILARVARIRGVR